MSTTARVGVVVVNYNGGELTRRCLDSLLATEWPRDRFEIILVDNASDDGVAEWVGESQPRVRVLVQRENRGFGAGCNVGLRDLRDCDYVALVNPDVVVEPGWLAPLAGALDRDPGLGAVAPKVLLAWRYQAVTLESRGPARRAHGRVRLTGVRVADRDVTGLIRYRRGWSGPDGAEPDRGRWVIDPIAELAVPVVDEDPVAGALRLRGCGEQSVSLSVGDRREAVTVDPADAWHAIELDGAAGSLLNGVGVELSRDGFASDRGYLEPDEGQFDQPGEIDAWSGSAVLLRRSYLETTGPFDERLFLYYEDIDLSLRGRELGWRYESEPASVVRHAHSASTVADSELVRYYNDRNRLLVLARHQTAGEVARAALRFVAVTASYGARDLRARFGRGACVPERGIAASRVRAFWGFVRNLPSALVARRRWRATARERALKSSRQPADG